MLELKAFIVARREFVALVTTRAFLIGLLLVPGLGALAVLLAPRSDSVVQSGPRTVALVDHTGKLAAPLERAAREVGLNLRSESAATVDGAAEARWVGQVRNGELAALLVVPAKAIDEGSAGADASLVLTTRNAASHSTVWLEREVTTLLRVVRLERAGVEPTRAQALLREVPILVRSPEGTGEESSNSARKSVLIPIFSLMLVFLSIMSSAPYMLHSVIEEKQQRIAELLLGAMSPFELMAGKLIGAAAAGLTVAVVYAAVGSLAAYYFGLWGLISPGLIALSLADVCVALVMFGSLFLAAGASAADLKDAQGLMAPLILLMALPMGLLAPIAGDPDGQLAVGLSLFPLTAPMILPLRLATTSVPAWQTAASISGALAATLASVWVAGRIFRVGILAQGKSPRFRELLRWIGSA
jgi:ABC-2 type transport system permease protein